MQKIILAGAAVFVASFANAQECPPFFRFVDFGLIDKKGMLSRGGPLLRGESFEGTTLLAIEETQCEVVRDLASDGHGNPIPVVSSISYDVAKIEFDLTRFHVSVLDNAVASAEENAAPHRERVGRFETVKGQNSLCAISSESRELSCQVTSPYKIPAPLVVYCGLEFCRMPVMSMDQRVAASAIWAFGDDFWRNPETTGETVFDKVQEIHGFLEPLSSGF